MTQKILILFGFISCTLCIENLKLPYVCDFETDNCGIKNDPDEMYLAKWVRKYMNLGGKQGWVLALETSGKEKQAGMALTPKFKDNMYGLGCLTYDVLITGYPMLTAQSENDDGVRSLTVISENTTEWKSYSTLIIPGQRNYIRFHFLGQIYPSYGNPFLAIDNIVYEPENNCSRFI